MYPSSLAFFPEHSRFPFQNFHFKSVLCYRDELVVLHLARNMVTQFGLVDLQINKFLGVFGKQNVDFPVDTVLGEISPDGTYCLIQIPSTRNNRVYMFQWYDLRSRVLLHELMMPSRTALFSFDPRFTNSRIAVTNFDRSSFSSISLVNTITWERLASNNHVLSHLLLMQPCLRRLTYSKAGHLLLVVCSEEEGCRCTSRSRRSVPPTRCHLLLFNADSLQRLKTIRFERYVCTLHACPVNYSVVLSRCGGRVALLNSAGDLPQADVVSVYQLPPPPSLQAIVREKILQVSARRVQTKGERRAAQDNSRGSMPRAAERRTIGGRGLAAADTEGSMLLCTDISRKTIGGRGLAVTDSEGSMLPPAPISCAIEMDSSFSANSCKKERSIHFSEQCTDICKKTIGGRGLAAIVRFRLERESTFSCFSYHKLLIRKTRLFCHIRI